MAEPESPHTQCKARCTSTDTVHTCTCTCTCMLGLYNMYHTYYTTRTKAYVIHTFRQMRHQFCTETERVKAKGRSLNSPLTFHEVKSRVFAHAVMYGEPRSTWLFSDWIDEGVLSRAAMDVFRRALYVRMVEVPRYTDQEPSLRNLSNGTEECALGGNLDADTAIPVILGINLAAWLVRL